MNAAPGRIDSIEFFAALADEMNSHPERFHIIGDAEMDALLVMHRPGTDFRVRLRFDGLRCDDVAAVAADEEHLADFRLVGDIGAWRAMFADIAEHRHATGLQTINSLALLGDKIALVGNDPMGSDKFSRFNQTLQEFLDGASIVLSGTPAPSR